LAPGVIPADAYREVGGRATQDAKAEAGIQGLILNNKQCFLLKNKKAMNRLK